MGTVENYDHQSGVHCGATALRNVARYYGWHYSEAACFGIGGGAAFVLYEHPEKQWVTFRASSTWMERAFFERVGVPHSYQNGEDFGSAWENATARVDDDDPVILFLDPSQLPYLPEAPAHLSPHVAVLVGYDEETAYLSDGAMETRQEVSRETLKDAWTSDGVVPLDNEYLTVTRARRTEDGTDAAAAGLREAATYMIEPLHVKRDARGPGQEGVPALRSFGDYLGTWPDLPEPYRPVRAAQRSIDEHGEGAAFRGLFADSLEELGQRTGLAHDISDRMAGVAEEWRTVAERLGEILEADDLHPSHFEEAAGLVGDIAEREEAIFEGIADELGHVEDYE
jgi:hypothetical protein